MVLAAALSAALLLNFRASSSADSKLATNHSSSALMTRAEQVQANEPVPVPKPDPGNGKVRPQRKPSDHAVTADCKVGLARAKASLEKNISHLSGAARVKASRYPCLQFSKRIPSRIPPSGKAQPEGTPIAIPSWCTDDGYVWCTRITACQLGTLTLTVTDVETGAVTGMGYYNLAQLDVMSTGSSNWINQVQITETNATGDGEGQSAYGAATCNFGCTVDYTDGLLGTPMVRNVRQPLTLSALTTFNAPASATFGESSMSFYFESPQTLPSSPVQYSDLVTVRCDNIRPGVGCVVPQYVPTVNFSISAVRDDVTTHMFAATESGLPGYWEDGIPLHYLMDPTKQDANRARGCPSGWTRPPGKQCDEYPFASTYEERDSEVEQGEPFRGATFRSHLTLPVPPAGVAA